MPEGDTIHRAARTLHTALAGKLVTRFETVLAMLARVDDEHPIRGRTIERVHAIGKHLLIEFSGGLALHTHMRMNGEWHIYRSGEKWMRPRRDMRVVIETSDWIAVAFNVPVADFRDARDLPDVGPDLIAADFDIVEAKKRIRELGDQEIANALLDQRAVAGIGNIWKSETLFVCHMNPFTHVDAIDDAKLDEILATARKLMRHSVARGGERRWVYERGGEPCRKCGTRIESRKQGVDARVTYWCPKCQLQ